MAKYGNHKVRYAGATFDSKAEVRRYRQLQVLERVGLITDLKRQVAYELAPPVKFAGKTRRQPALRIIVDFTYRQNGTLVVEDTKSPASITTAFTIKRHLLKHVHGLDIHIVQS